MITENDLLEAIAECQGQRNPNANTCIKLAAYYTILQNLKGEDRQSKEVMMMPSYSYDPAPSYESDSEFGQIASRNDPNDVLKIVDELMETLRIMQPRLYDAFIRKLTAI